MPKSLKTFILLLVAITLLVGVIVFVYNTQGERVVKTAKKIYTTKESTPSSSQATSSAQENQKVNTNVFNIDSKGFNPKFLTIKPGEKVKWVNKDTKVHEVASDPHPTHLDYAPFNTIGKLNSGQDKSLTFPVPGTYRFHDHSNPTSTGSVTVR